MKKKQSIGYGKPPEHTRFRPGESGNRKGRPKGSRNTYKILDDVLQKNMTIMENGKPVRISRKSAILIQLVNKSLKGDMKAINLLLPHLLLSDMKEEERKMVIDSLSSDDQAILNLMKARFNDSDEDEFPMAS